MEYERWTVRKFIYCKTIETRTKNDPSQVSLKESLKEYPMAYRIADGPLRAIGSSWWLYLWHKITQKPNKQGVLVKGRDKYPIITASHQHEHGQHVAYTNYPNWRYQPHSKQKHFKHIITRSTSNLSENKLQKGTRDRIDLELCICNKQINQRNLPKTPTNKYQVSMILKNFVHICQWIAT